MPTDHKRHFWTEYWNRLYEAPRAWAHQGERLIHAFEAVAEAAVLDSHHLDMRDQALMLAGMSVEVMLKAIIVSSAENRRIVTSSKAITAAESDLRKVFYSHRLADLAAKADVQLSQEQSDVAQALTQYILWRGRYVLPTDKGIDDLIPIVGRDGLVGPSHRDVTTEDARALIAMVKSRLYA